ncbi:MAG: hypothetical protein HY925_16350, partial [Elusimicrobia bacterium]|nr:hypothetical protein [Elusimicrobiota bacterium]
MDPADDDARGTGAGAGVKLTAAGVLVSVLILAYLLYGTRHLWHVVEEIDRGYALAAVVCAFASYVMIGVALWDVLRVLGHR